MRPPGMLRWPELCASETLRLIVATSNDGRGACPSTTLRASAAKAHANASVLLKLLADILFLAPVLDAFGARHRALADHFHLKEIEDALHLAHLQRRRRIGELEVLRLEIRLLHVVAAAIRIGEAVVGRHAFAGPAAFDRH